MVARHEKVNAQLWDARLQTWRPLLPFGELDLPYSTDWAVNLGTLTLPGDHPQSASLTSIRDGAPRPVRFTINGVIWDGQITRAELKSENGQAPVWHCQVESDAKHGHRMQARDTAVSAADMTATRLQGWLGDVTRRLVASAAQRTGLPVYILVEGEGDPIEVEARTEDTVHDVLQDATVGSRMHLDVRRLLPEDSLPGSGMLFHLAGVMERQWEQAELDAGEWPHATTHGRITGVVEPHPQLLLPARSWRGEGTVDMQGAVVEEREGICWVPFETKVTTPADYFNRPDPVGVRVATVDELRAMQDEYPEWATHLTYWEVWTPESPDSLLLGEAIGEGLVVFVGGNEVTSVAEVDTYVGGGGLWAWRDGSRWTIANEGDFATESSRRTPRGDAQRQTPGLLVHLHPERDRRGVVFSSTPGGGLEAWSVAHTAGDGAMVIMGAQMDERIIAAAREGLLPPSLIGSYTPSEAQGVLPSGSEVPGTVDRVDVDAQPLAAIDGTEVTYTSAGGRVDLARAGVMFYRERYLSLPSSGGGDPVHEITRAYAEAQGTSTMSLTPGSSSSVVFGDDVRRPDGTVIPGWRPGDRVSFVDQWTRISEVIAGYRLKATNGRLVSAVPILGRQETGVLAGLGARLRQAERDAIKAKLAPPRRLPEQELIAAAAQQAADAMLEESRQREAALQAEREAREAERDAAELARWEEQMALIEANIAAIADSATATTHSIFLNWDETTVDSDYLTLTRTSSSRVGWTIKPGWVGDFEITGATGSSSSSFGTGIYMRKLFVPNPEHVAFTFDDGIGSVQVTINVHPGKPATVTPTIPDQTVSRDWVTISTWTAPQDTQVIADASLIWENKTFVATYGMRIMVGGQNATTSSTSSRAPLLGHAARAHSAAMNVRRVSAGSVVSLQVKADHSNSLNRMLRDAQFRITWIDGALA